MMDIIFERCVLLLVLLADRFGMTYQAVNVWIFVILWPTCTLILTAIVILQRFRIRDLSDRTLGQMINAEGG